MRRSRARGSAAAPPQERSTASPRASGQSAAWTSRGPSRWSSCVVAVGRARYGCSRAQLLEARPRAVEVLGFEELHPDEPVAPERREQYVDQLELAAIGECAERAGHREQPVLLRRDDIQELDRHLGGQLE